MKLGVAGVDVRDPVHVDGVEFGDDAAGTNSRFVDHPLVLSPESVDSLGGGGDHGGETAGGDEPQA